MNDKEKRDAYADELRRRYIEYTDWALQHWPVESFPLMESDFSASGRELSEILGAKLAKGEHEGGNDDSPAEHEPQYINVTPMPWP
ncbi:hypothetical protein [Glaciimonas immobilis]|uniref:Uncharacterized protein n=1 Tax=Glaciimonas immobilis TaxID=728004 RepID=A0A840RRZ0_9BURK|nr:hypothetical protein [Glaciimonas immobilis]KAF3998062.1 hypothetical protein HAV38_10940 [Glaciimonas immobilis]MBB5199249.1 hypothetical protein [Glaciimonas immobilis]